MHISLVGYNGISTEYTKPEGGTVNTKYKGVGSVFIPVEGVGEGNTYKLKDLSVQFDDPEEFLIPGNEYFQQLSPIDTDVKGRFTYVSKEWIDDEFKNPSTKYWAIGWWENDRNIVDYIDDGDSSKMCNEEDIPVGTAFLGAFSTARKYRIVSSGAVPTETTAITTEKTKYLYWLNYLPVSFDLNKLAVKAIDNEGEVLSDEFVVPGNEYFQVLSPIDTDVIGRYTYVSKEFLDDEFGKTKAPAKYWAIGWWENDRNIVDYIDDDDDSKMLKGGKAIMLTPGFSFLSAVSSGKNYKIFFPSALDAAK